MWRYDLILVAITAVWGSTFTIGKDLAMALSPLNYLSLRFVFAALFTSFLYRQLIPQLDSGALHSGILLGVLLAGGFISQAVGLLYTTPSKAAIISGTSVVLVPFADYLLTGARLKIADVISVALAFVGFSLVVFPGSIDDVNIGDLISSGSILFWALHIVYTGKFSRTTDAGQLTLVQFWACALVLLLAFVSSRTVLEANLLASDRWPTTLLQMLSLAYLVVFATVLVILLQTWAQSKTEATRVAIIFSLEPVFAALISAVAGAEKLSELTNVRFLSGSSMIIAAVIVSGVYRGR
ncbi:MAG: DMT family transporter [Acidobacteriota bacterium]|nr:DMT family transporter [Blastocatellia bacterium]MDW8412752.1 DMT family transporter [Acidobacteriota bacterium]